MATTETPDTDIVILAREAASVLRGFYDDVTPCVHRLKAGERCALCGRARALLIECDAIVSEVEPPRDGPIQRPSQGRMVTATPTPTSPTAAPSDSPEPFVKGFVMGQGKAPKNPPPPAPDPLGGIGP